MLRKDFFLNTITKWLVQSVIYSLYFDTFNVSLKKKQYWIVHYIILILHFSVFNVY